MIKIENIHKSESYWKQDGLYDNKAEKTTKIKLFGLTIWQRKNIFDCTLVEFNHKSGMGFAK